MGEVWKSVWSECGGCVEVGESVSGCGEVWGCGSANTLFYTFPHTLHTNPTPLPTLTQHLSPHPHTQLTRLSILFYTHLPTLSHTRHTFPSPPPTFFHTHSPYLFTTPTPPPTLSYAPHTLSFASCQNFSLFSFIAKLV